MRDGCIRQARRNLLAGACKQPVLGSEHRGTAVAGGATGLEASSGGVSRMEACSAALTIIPVIASRPSVAANRQSIVCRAASAYRFQWLHVVRFSATAATTAEPSLAIRSSGTSAARSSSAGSTVTAS